MSMSDLGYYEKSYRLMMLPLQNITQVITGVITCVIFCKGNIIKRYDFS